jgi:hypothetical protein
MTDELLSQINEKLDRIIGLMALQGVEDDAEKVLRLNALGLDHRTVAALTGTTANAVALRLSRLRRGRR